MKTAGMARHLGALGTAFALVVGLSACSASADKAESDGGSTTATPEVPDLSGVWDTVDADGPQQQAVISGSTITINWLSDDTSDPMLYWAGSFEAPSSTGSYSWSSANDHGQTDTALLASSDESKEFSYAEGQINYEVSALGETSTVTLEQTSTTVPETADAASSDAAAGTASVVDSGMGVDGDYAWVSAMIEHDGLTGEFATVLFNIYDENDELIASEEQVEVLGTAGTTFPIGTQVSLPAESTASRVDATVSVSDYGSSQEAMPVVEAIEATADDLRFTVQNTTSKDWTDPRIAIVCHNDAGEIVGGGVDFPNAIPANGEFLVKDSTLITAEDTATCDAYVQLEASN
ncbi:hypothetical protein SAMN04489860_0823 [Paraoerskovia marina]|uniref:Uncharacterized protein n=1 Tax=Paraoerskovia marina TaxID=545619 RepID=A0A1H1PJ75_9CELL|nr:hypothetical protein [Paraoerskovia marina]SDS11292.1 hypothetical protein SAMN04489860_0823 [Paraoerskovia marina]